MYFRGLKVCQQKNPQREASYWEDSADVHLVGIKALEKLKQGCL